ncbi:MAG TPA: ankyrin repeat domain-containing protein [Vicinamibacterales bacterium]
MTEGMAAAARLRQDVTTTLGAAHAGVVERHAQRLLPLAWPADALAAKLIDGVQHELHETFVDTSWPHCPAHPNHPLWFDEGAWRCSGNGAALAGLGDLDAVYFNDAIVGWRKGDFDRLAPLFAERGGEAPLILQWHREGRFEKHPSELAEALSNACFLGRTDVVRALIEAGVDPATGTGCGMDGLHWAVNRGKLETVKLLIERGAPLETINMHGITALGTAVWSAINEPWWGRAQLEIIEALLDAGARVEGAGYPTGHPEIDSLLEKYGANTQS